MWALQLCPAVKPALLALTLLATNPGVEAKSELEERLAHCEEVVERNDDFNVLRQNFKACMAD